MISELRGTCVWFVGFKDKYVSKFCDDVRNLSDDVGKNRGIGIFLGQIWVGLVIKGSGSKVEQNLMILESFEAQGDGIDRN